MPPEELLDYPGGRFCPLAKAKRHPDLFLQLVVRRPLGDDVHVPDAVEQKAEAGDLGLGGGDEELGDVIGVVCRPFGHEAGCPAKRA